MNFNFSAWSIRNPVPPILLFFVLMMVGIFSFRSLPITQFPNIDVPLVLVSVGQSGATPAELESQITKKVEDAVAAITGVKHITSTMRDGSSNTAIEFRLEVPTEKAVQDVKMLSLKFEVRFLVALMNLLFNGSTLKVRPYKLMQCLLPA